MSHFPVKILYVSIMCGFVGADPSRDGVGNQRGNLHFSVSGRKCVCVDLPDGGFPAPLGVGEFGGVTGGRSSVCARLGFPRIPGAGSWGR